MKEKIVYFLGAGFSAPLGLPVMSNFLIRSKDLYFSDPDKYEEFGKVFKVIDLMGKAKNYYAVDLFNIEEILSLLEMEDYVGASAHKQSYLSYLRKVIMDLTPTPTPAEGSPWIHQLFTPDPLLDSYAAFVASLFRLEWTGNEDNEPLRNYRIEQRQDAPTTYGVISLNYDLVLENCLDLIKRRGGSKLRFAGTVDEATGEGTLPVAKLHGSVEPLTIVPPTWNKVASEEVKESWKLAYRLLVDATQVRFIGYSLPASDNYVRYLLESAVLESQHLKRIDVICLDDPHQTIERRFRSLINFYRFRFRSLDVCDYLTTNHRQARGVGPVKDTGSRTWRMGFNKLEAWHEVFMERTVY